MRTDMALVIQIPALGDIAADSRGKCGEFNPPWLSPMTLGTPIKTCSSRSSLWDGDQPTP